MTGPGISDNGTRQAAGVLAGHAIDRAGVDRDTARAEAGALLARRIEDGLIARVR